MEWRKRSYRVAFGEGVGSLYAYKVEIFAKASLLVLPDLFTHVRILNYTLIGEIRVLFYCGEYTGKMVCGVFCQTKLPPPLAGKGFFPTELLKISEIFINVKYCLNMHLN